MNGSHPVLILLSLLLILVLLSLLYILRNMFLPTRGRRIREYAHPSAALLVMDIQESSGIPAGAVAPPPVSTPFGRMIHAVNLLIDGFDRAGLEVAYVRQVFKGNFITRLHGGRILAGRMTPRICRWVKVVNGNDFPKNRTDAFSNRDLERFLVERQVKDIYLVGLDAAFCVYYTALGAMQRGYRVTVVTDAVMTGREWSRVLEKYRSKGISMMGSQELILELAARAGSR